MAGGVGSRFWPVSTASFPKQFHDMLGTGETLIQRTFKRLHAFIPVENIFILTNERYNELVLEQLPQISQRQVVLEPAMRNTAPCILYAAMKIEKMNPDAVMVVAPSDHWIEDEAAFAKDVQKCFAKCEKEQVLCTLGIQPSFPNTGFGYIEYQKTQQEDLKEVIQFREKPDYETAQYFIAQGNFLWNAGIFMWSAKTIINAFQDFQPEEYKLFKAGYEVYNTEKEQEFILENYPKADNISIDYAILEKSRSTYVLLATFDWNDLGTWGSLFDKLDKSEDKNALVNGLLLARDSRGNMVRTTGEKLVVLDGLNDYIIVDKENVLLVFPKSKEQDIKEVLASVKEKFGDKHL